MSTSYIESIFGPEGRIARYHDAYEFRDGQLQMALAIDRAFDSKRHLIVEAGTGTGKTLAYLVPAIAATGDGRRRIVISTGTKNLQEQLMEKDIPFLQKALPNTFGAAYMKGRANYLCIYRMQRSADQPMLDGVGDVSDFNKVADWARGTSTGDRAELVTLPENLSFWSRINARSDICIGQKCPDFEPCFVTRMRERANAAEIVIVNHHLFFADLNVRDNQFGRVIPDYSAVIFDEAHLLEDIAADYFGVQVSNFQIDEIVRDAAGLSIPDAVLTSAVLKIATRVSGLSEQFWARAGAAGRTEGRWMLEREAFFERLADGEETPTGAGEAYEALDNALKRLETEIDLLSDKDPEAESIVRRIRQARFDIDFVLRQKDKNFVYWLERRGRGIFLQASPVDVSELLREKLFDKVDTCVLTSATLSANGSFNFIRDRLGLAAAKTDTLVAESSFDHERQSLLYMPRGLPDPRSPDFVVSATEEIIGILTATQGRAFVLCTSSQSMSALYELVSSRIGYPCFVQGSMSKAGLIDKFRSTQNAVLFATSSFWQGVDVRGEQLSCVIIDKLPFAVPTDPLVAARARFIDENGGRSFTEYTVPQAVITLKQGIGRLIRSTSDRGVVAILDPRLRTKPYGRDFLQSLPRMRIVDDLDKVREFLEP